MARDRRAEKLSERYCWTDGDKFKLSRVDPADTGPFKGELKDEAKALIADTVDRLQDLQEKLYAQDRWSVLLVFQAMDAAGKDGVIKHVMSGINPQGCQVHSFKAPSAEELDHDFLWRCATRLPERGRIGIFNRSYYEELLVVRVHKQLLAAQHLPPAVVGKKIWKQRFDDINAWERYLARNGTIVLKFFLHVSREEQKKRFLERLDDPAKNWKFQMGDVRERAHWNAYMDAYEDLVRHTATEHAPWYVVPADNKWYTRLIVAAAVEQAIEGLGLHFPRLDVAKRKELAAARTALLKEKS